MTDCTVKTILENDRSQLNAILKKCRLINKLNGFLKQFLDESFKPHVQTANIENSKIILFVSSATWGTRLHFMLPDLLQQIQSQDPFQSIKKIDIKIRPDVHSIKSISS